MQQKKFENELFKLVNNNHEQGGGFNKLKVIWVEGLNFPLFDSAEIKLLSLDIKWQINTMVLKYINTDHSKISTHKIEMP